MSEEEHAAAPPEALPLYASVEGALAGAIAKGSLAAGDVLTEAAVSDVLGTSRTPVRLAFERLSARGLLVKGTGQGFRVAGAEGGRRRRLGREALSNIMEAGAAPRSPAAWTAIYDEVEREISARSVFGAFRVIEVELANAYGVSRTVAHEVLTRLERLSLVENDRRGRWFVVPLTVTRVEQIYEVRRYLEPPALAAACPRIPAEDLADMWHRVVEAQRRYPDVGIDELDGLERDIHVDCIAYCRNDELIKLLRINQALLISNKHMLGSYLTLPELDPFLAEHGDILDRLRARDSRGAARSLDHHLRSSLAKVLHRLSALVASKPPAPPAYLVEG